MIGRIEKREDEKENEKKVEKWKNKRDFSFPYLYLVGRVKKWSDKNLFCLVEKKNERIEN